MSIIEFIKIILKDWSRILEKRIQKTWTWFLYFKKILSRNRKKIEGRIKSLIALIYVELKHTNPIGEIVVENTPSLVELFLLKIECKRKSKILYS